MSNVVQLFPQPGMELSLEGLYLSHRLDLLTGSGRPFVYTNFISSLDGRIALKQPRGDHLEVPAAVTNSHDWRLFLELEAQAHVVITSDRYLCEYAQGKAQDILSAPYTDDRYADLQRWRQAHNLPLRPALAVLSETLDFPLPDILDPHRQPVLVFTAAAADRAKIDALRQRGVEVVGTGEGSGVDGRIVIATLAARGHQLIYSAAGPRVLHALLAGRVLDRLYLTTACRLLGGDEFAAVVKGPVLNPPYDLQLEALYYDREEPATGGQLLACYTAPTQENGGGIDRAPADRG
ncbi:MAG: RibD family protein [Porticoccaceae bacterium]